MAQGTPVSLTVGQTATVADVESNAGNPNIPIPDLTKLQTASDGPAVTISADGLTATGAAANADGTPATANVTRLDTSDPNNQLSSTTVFTVSGGVTPPGGATDLTSTWTANAARRSSFNDPYRR
jgi:hypothetical protein